MVLEIYPYLDGKSIKKVESLFPVKIRNYYDLFFSNQIFKCYINEKNYFKGHYYLNCQSKDLTEFWDYYFEKDDTFIRQLENLNQLLITSTVKVADVKGYLPVILKYLNDEADIASLAHFLDEISDVFTYRNTLFLEALNLKIDRINQNINFNIMNTIAKWLKKKSKTLTDQAIVQEINTAIKRAIYKEIQTIYNQRRANKSPRLSVMYCYLQTACYPYKYRYDTNEDFIVPYGGTTYNELNFEDQLIYLKSNSSLFNGTVSCRDYAGYLQSIEDKVTADDFISAIPPVNTDTLSYNKLPFNADNEKHLFSLLKDIKCRFLLVLNKSEFTTSIKEHTNLKIVNIRSKYPFISKDQHTTKEQKVIIKNY